MPERRSPNELAEDTETVHDFIAFLRAMEADFRERGSEWENQTLDSFFERLAAWLESSAELDEDGNVRAAHGIDANEASWWLFAGALAVTRDYE